MIGALRDEAGQIWSLRGSTSRNKVSVGEPAEGSLQMRCVYVYVYAHVCVYIYICIYTSAFL
jgi:hypothetical protein